MKIFPLISFFLFIFSQLHGQLKTPDEFLGYELGTQFTRHHQVIDYVNYLATKSDYIISKPYGKTYEGRTLQLAYLSKPENLSQLEELRKNHLYKIGYEEGVPNSSLDISVVWLSYNVHGNESSSTEAALKTLHTLITEKKDWLNNLVVIVDPCINPDGRDRYVNWYNQIKSTPFDNNPLANEHYEEWPGGRYNHYYHDLNRDWAWLSQVESQQRLPAYLAWMPQIHVDFHEQGINSPYYFAPAVEPYHEIISDFQREFQVTLGKNHASYFDKEGWLYFTDESFDLLYPGYGDTYPMFNGSIGMTYEQAGGGRAGLSIITAVGDNLTLKDRIEHHFTTGLSTVEVAHKNSGLLNKEFQDYHSKSKGKFETYVIEGHPDKMKALTTLLKAHEIEVKQLANKTKIKGIDYATQQTNSKLFRKGTLIIEGKKKKSNLIQALLEPQTEVVDSLTYDITSWSLPYAYGLKAMASNQLVASNLIPTQNTTRSIDPKAYAYAAERKSFQDGRFIAALVKAGIRIYYNEISLDNGGKTWDAGSIFILRGENRHLKNLGEVISEIASETSQEITSLTTGFSSKGPDLGSNRMKFIQNKNIGLLKSDQASPAGYGEVWHFFEQQLNYPITQLDDQRLSKRYLENIDVLIIPPGRFNQLLKNESLLDWLSEGGRIVALGSALKAFAKHDEFDLKEKENTNTKEDKKYAFGDQERENIRSAIYGSIYNADVDTTHPLALGYDKNYFTLKTSASAYELNKGVNTVASLAKDIQPMAGFSGELAIKQQSESLLIGVESFGRGSVVYMVDNPLYRSFWENGKLWLVNAIFY